MLIEDARLVVEYYFFVGGYHRVLGHEGRVFRCHSHMMACWVLTSFLKAACFKPRRDGGEGVGGGFGAPVGALPDPAYRWQRGVRWECLF